MKQIVYKWLATIFLVFPLITMAQGDSLLNYLQIAAENNPLVKQRYYEFQAALERIPQAGTLPDPELTAGVFLRPMELVMGNQVADLSLMQMFPWFGVLKNGKDEMSYMAKASYESLRDAKLQVFYDVQRTWFDMYRLQKDIEVTEKNIGILRVIERLALTRYRSGSSAGSAVSSSSLQSTARSGSSSGITQPGMSSMGFSGSGNSQSSGSSMSAGGSTGNAGMSSSQSSMSGGSSPGLAEIYRIQIEISELENSLLSLKDQQRTVLSRFNAFLNRPALTPVSLPDTLVSDSLNTELTSLPDSILANSPMLAMLQLEQQSLDARKEMNRLMGLPMVGIGLNYSVIKPNEMEEAELNGRDMVMPMVKLTLPIYRKKYRSSQDEASALKNASEQSYKVTANNLLTEYYEALQLYNDAQRRLILYRNQSELAQRSLDIMIKSFSSATGQLTDVLTVRQQLLNYELLQVQAVTDYNTAIAWLKRLSGKMPS